MLQHAGVPPERRWSRGWPCPICDGHPYLPQGKGVRCYGFLSVDAQFAHCTREDFAGSIPHTPASNTYAHRLGPAGCLCHVTHLVPASAAPPLAQDNREPQPVGETYYEYIDESGHTVAIHKRIDYDDGSKVMPWCDTEGNHVRGVKLETLPLFGLPALSGSDSSVPVFFTEGEKAASAVIAVGSVGVCCCGGSGQQEFGDAFAPLAGRTVFLLPDNDEPGAAYMRRVKLAMEAAGAEPIIVPLPGVPPKGDAVEYLGAHTAADLQALCAAALARQDAGVVTLDPARHPAHTVVHVSDFLSTPFPAPSWIVDGVLLRGGTSLMVAKAKVGKSTEARKLLWSVLTGSEWRIGEGSQLISRRTREGPCLYFPMEDHMALLQRQIRENVHPMAPLYIRLPPKDGADDAPDYDPAEVLEKLIEDTGAILVVLDPLADFMRIADLNNYMEVRRALMRIHRVARRTNAHILVTHHSNKNGVGTDAIMGSAALSGAVDTMLLMQRIEVPNKDQPHKRLGDRWMWSVQRYGADLPETRL